MADATHMLSAKTINPIPYPLQAKNNFLNLKHQLKIRSDSRKHDQSPIRKRNSKPPRHLIKISTSDGKWHGNWNCDYSLSLHDLQLQDLVEGEQKNAEVSINLSIEKHASFGLSIDGRIITSFTRRCSNCSSPYCKQIDTNFNVWVLPSSSRDTDALQLPEIGGDDPSVIYVKPGDEASLDSLIQDTLRLTSSVKDTCSELCEKSESTFHFGGQKASVDKRWSKLLELRNPK